VAANAERYSLNAVALVEILHQLLSDSLEALELGTAFLRSYRIIWVVMCALAGVVLLGSLFVKEYDMNQEHVTDQGFMHSEMLEM
jgi:hypothetical protein